MRDVFTHHAPGVLIAATSATGARAPAITEETGSAAKLWGADAASTGLVVAGCETGALAPATTIKSESAAKL